MSFDFDHSHDVKEAVEYLRVSSKSQTRRGDGLQGQKTRCDAYAEYKGYTVVKTFQDDLTGRQADRQGLRDLITFLRKDRSKRYVVIVDDLTRFARKVSVHFDLKETISRAGGILESPSVELRDDADGELHEYILASVAQHQSRKNAEQSHNRMKARLLNGYWCFAKPKGYQYKLVKGRGKILYRDEPLAGIIQEGLELFASGHYESQSELKRYFESQPAFPKDRRTGTVHPQRVTDILKQPLYAGYLEAPKWGISFRKAQHEPLISLETWQKNQERLKGAAKAPARKDIGADFPLKGFVVCGYCQKPLTANWCTGKMGKKYPFYRCYNKKCNSPKKSVRRGQVEGDFEKLLEGMQPSKEMFEFIGVMLKSAWDQRLNQWHEITVGLKRDQARIEKQADQLLERIVEADSTAVIKAYEKKIDELEKRKLLITEKLSKNSPSKHTFEEMFELALRFLGNPHKIWVSGHIHLQRLVLRLGFMERIVYTPGEGYSNPKKTLPFSMLGGENMVQTKMAPAPGVEPGTY